MSSLELITDVAIVGWLLWRIFRPSHEHGAGCDHALEAWAARRESTRETLRRRT